MKSLKNILAGSAFVLAASTAFAYKAIIPWPWIIFIFLLGYATPLNDDDVPEDLTLCNTTSAQMCIVTFQGQQYQAFADEQLQIPLKRDF
ncbi:hypothetical protein FNH22_03770 [Fulvivirga sp. M361]|uniref:hypothetical protein n=1 Tax=Fulvivirga sp. M361 TaxID=2594266 RepID=UPI00117AB6AC|nr:hypothetical protein [Fulvivirga sp. M361]TRX61183.1 hypothetical protein FNH22_03770 [Fulvivirga sp. M361]